LRKLVKNKQLRGLVGGVENVTLGDIAAKEEARKRGADGLDKTRAERAGPPIFDVIVELRRGELHEWLVVEDSGKAVDRILEGAKYDCQKRTRNDASGEFWLELYKA
jgi:hypothetical protein